MVLRKKTALWGTALILASAAACNGSKGGGGDGDGDGDGDTASGGEDSQSSGGSMGGAGPNTGGAFMGSGGSMGGTMDPCGEITVLSESETTYATFEDVTVDEPEFAIKTAEAGVYWYDDGSAEATNDFAEGIEGDQSLHLLFEPGSWGAGAGFWSTCVDASVFTGISFWAKGELPEGSQLQVELHVPETTFVGSDSGTGDCLGVAGLSCFPNKTLLDSLTDTWTQYSLTWDEFTGGSNVGVPVTLDPTRLNGINFHSPGAAGTIELFIDDIRFTTEDINTGGAGGGGGAEN